MGKLKETVRGDGLRIISKELCGTNKVMFTVAALVGSASDPENALGLFHFFEHMAFQGTKTRNAKQIATFLDRYCRCKNAGTGRLLTQYYGEAVKQNAGKLFDIISDMYLNPTFPEEELSKERNVIRNEIAMYADKDDYVAFFNLMKLLYQKNSARELGAGTSESIDSIDRKTLLDMHGRFYTSPNTVVVAVGKVKHEDVLERVNQLFSLGQLAHSKKPVIWDHESEILPSEKKIVILKPQREQAAVLFGFKLPNMNDAERITACILADLFGKGQSSPLYQELRQNRGLVYNTGASLCGQDSLFQAIIFEAATLNKNVNQVVELIPKLIREYPLQEDLFLEMKDKKKEESTVSVETVWDWNAGIIEQVSKGEDIKELENYSRRYSKIIDLITFKDVLEMRERFLKEERQALSIVRS